MPESDEFADKPIINSEKLEKILTLFKYPILLGICGLVMLIVALIILFKQNSTGPEVVFTTQATSSATKKITVDIAGAVIKPGVYEFTEGERISDGLIKAGGLALTADRDWMAKNLNKAAKLVDGGKVYIPSVVEATQKQNQYQDEEQLLGVTTGKININTAPEKELDTLPGVGSVTAQKIIKGRPYLTVEDLKTKKVIGNSLFEKLKNLLIAN